MNSKQIYQKYLETLWEVIREQKLRLFVIPDVYNGIKICQESEYEQLLSKAREDHQKYHKTYFDSKNINTFEELVALTESKDKTNLKNSISSDIIYSSNKHNEYIYNDLTTKFNTTVLLSLLEKIERSDDKPVFDNLDSLCIRWGDVSKIYWNIIQFLNEKYGKEKGIELFNAIPLQVDDFTKRDSLKKDILNILNRIKYFFGEDYHQLTCKFVNKRAKQACASQIGSVSLRDALIEFYANEPELLEDYKDTVPSIGKYLDQTDDGDFFLQKSPRIISRIIDTEELKAVTSIRISSNDHYLTLIRTFLGWFKAKDKRVLSFDASYSRLNKNDAYISVFVSSNPKNPLLEDEFDSKLKSFAKMLRKQNPEHPNEISHLMNKWWDADELDRQLRNDSNKKQAKMKI